jgi:hypothetical protein
MAPEINIFLGSPNLFRMQHINLEGYLARPAGMTRAIHGPRPAGDLRSSKTAFLLFCRTAGSLLPPDLPNKKGHLKVTFVIWRARQESNLQPPA